MRKVNMRCTEMSSIESSYSYVIGSVCYRTFLRNPLNMYTNVTEDAKFRSFRVLCMERQ